MPTISLHEKVAEIRILFDKNKIKNTVSTQNHTIMDFFRRI